MPELHVQPGRSITSNQLLVTRLQTRADMWMVPAKVKKISVLRRLAARHRARHVR
jgi:hypothetical protein